VSHRIRCILLFLPVYLFLSCGKDASTIGPSNPDFRYPLAVGEEWRYERRVTQTDDSGRLAPEERSVEVTVQVIGVESIFDAQAVKVREHVESNGVSLISYYFYENSKEALYLLGSIGEAVALPKRSAATVSPAIFLHSALWGLSHTGPTADSIYQEIPPKIALKYPLLSGTQWKFREKGQPRRIDKRVGDRQNIDTPAGTFDTVVIQWLMDFDGDGEFDDNVEFYDYIASIGLVKRTFRINHLPLLDDSGYTIGFYTYTDESILTIHTKD